MFLLFLVYTPLYVSCQTPFSLLQSSFLHVAKNMTAKILPSSHLTAFAPEKDRPNIHLASKFKNPGKKSHRPSLGQVLIFGPIKCG